MFLHDEKPEEIEKITNRMSDMTVTQPVPFDKKDARTRSMSNRSLSHDSVEAKHWAQTARGDTRTGSFGSTGSASSPIFIPNGGTTTNVPPRMYSFDLYESAGVATPDSESGDPTTMKGMFETTHVLEQVRTNLNTNKQTNTGTWPVIKSNTPTDGSVPAKTDGASSTFSPAATEGTEESSGSRLSFFQRLRSKSIPPSGSEEEQQQQQVETSSGGKKSAPTETAASKTKKGKKKKGGKK